MQLNSSDNLFDLPVLKMRQIIRYAMDEKLWGRSKSEIIRKTAAILEQPYQSAKLIIEKLIKENYIIIEKTGSYIIAEATVKGRSLGLKKAIPPISREKATGLLNGLIDRAKNINSNDYAYSVESIVVFGSYLSDKNSLGDLDVGVKLVRKKDFMRIHKERLRMAIASRRRFRNFTDELCWSQDEIWLILKDKKRSISIHNMDEDEIFSCVEYKVVFSASQKNDE